MIGEELRRLIEDGVTAEELERARENVKGRTVLSMESTSMRMNRLGSSVLMGIPLLTVDEVLAAFDAVTLDDVTDLARELWLPESLAAAGVGSDEDTFRSALGLGEPRARGVIAVAVSGAAGRMGQTVCAAVEGAEDMSWSAAPTRSSASRWPTCSATPTWSWTSARPTRRSTTRAPASRRACTA